jgi:SNF family Na+-dependent transporter
MLIDVRNTGSFYAIVLGWDIVYMLKNVHVHVDAWHNSKVQTIHNANATLIDRQ